MLPARAVRSPSVAATGRMLLRTASGAPPVLNRPGDASPRTVAVLPGHGIGPELTAVAMRVVKASGAPIQWNIVEGIRDSMPESALDAIRRADAGLCGGFSVGIGKGSPVSNHVTMCKKLDMYANVVHAHNLPGVASRHKDVDIVVIRESTEGEYSGMEHEVAPGITETLKVMSRDATRRIAEYAFEYAYLNNRSKVTAVHKANIMKKADGVFLESCRAVAKTYSGIEYEEIIVDNCMMQLVSKPQKFDVMVTPNFYGSLVSNVVAGLTGGPGMVGGANLGKNAAVFEQGARHVALDIAGKDVANPTGMLLATTMMLRHIALPMFANRIDSAIMAVLKEGHVLPRDLGGHATTTQYVNAILSKMA